MPSESTDRRADCGRRVRSGGAEAELRRRSARRSVPLSRRGARRCSGSTASPVMTPSCGVGHRGGPIYPVPLLTGAMNGKRRNRRQLSAVCLAGQNRTRLSHSKQEVCHDIQVSLHGFVSVASSLAPPPRPRPRPRSSERWTSRHRAAPRRTRQVNRAVALLHSFSLDPAVKGFTDAAQTDPSCGIAYWGVAMAWMGNPLAARPARGA